MQAGQASDAPAFHEELHVRFIRALTKKTDSFEHVVMEHLKVREDESHILEVRVRSPQLVVID
jgi:hypothetical protein